MTRQRLGSAQLLVRAAFLLGAVAAVIALLDELFLVVTGEHELVDFHVYYTAADAVLHGESPYPVVDEATLASGREYVYPPLTAIALVPLALLPASAAEGIALVIGALAAVTTLVVVGVRDWRCYVVAFSWVPVLNAIGLGNITVLLCLGAGLAWRFRDRELPVAVSVGVTLAAKIFLWPLVVWLAATRRLRPALLCCAVGAGLLAVSWAVLGWTGAGDYVDLLRIINSLSDDDAYSVYALALDAGASEALASTLWMLLAVLVLAGVVVVGRRGNDRGAFVLAVASAIAFSPIVWRHYFELLLVAVAVAQPTLGLVWFVPPAMWLVSTGSGNGTAFQTAATLLIAALTIALAYRASLADARPVSRPARPVPARAPVEAR